MLFKYDQWVLGNESKYYQKRIQAPDVHLKCRAGNKCRLSDNDRQ